MAFWIIAAVIAALTVAVLVFALLRGHAGRDSDARDIQVYRDQLSEVDRDLDRGVISTEDAERVRLEISRRLLDAKKNPGAQPAPGASRASPLLAAALALAVFSGAFAIYQKLGAPGYMDQPISARLAMSEARHDNRMSQRDAEAQVPAAAPPEGVTARHLELIEKLRNALKDRPNDLQGHILLAQNEAALGNFAAAASAQQKVVELKGATATADDYVALADMMALAAGGYISPETEAVLLKAISLDPQNGGARFYLGLMYAQIGRTDRAFAIWQALLEEGPADAPWIAPIRSQIEEVAREAGVRYSLPPQGTAPRLTAPGPSNEDIAAAQDMSAEERDAMVRSMVDRLSGRLADEGGTPQEWARLIGALGVLGETERASEAWNTAQDTFADAPDALAIIRGAAQNAGITP